MKSIGIIGGMSWQSTATYYKLINESVNQQLGGNHSAKLLIDSLDFGEIEHLQHKNDWSSLTKTLCDSAKKLESSGVDILLIATNTMHKVANEVQASINIPLIHIADALAHEVKKKELKTLGLLGTIFTMEQEFYTKYLREQHDIDVIVPEQEDRKIVHDVIYQELCRGIISNASKTEYLRIIDLLSKNGAQAIILGCTEIPMLVSASDTDVILLDTTTIHSEYAANLAVSS